MARQKFTKVCPQCFLSEPTVQGKVCFNCDTPLVNGVPVLCETCNTVWIIPQTMTCCPKGHTGITTPTTYDGPAPDYYKGLYEAMTRRMPCAHQSRYHIVPGNGLERNRASCSLCEILAALMALRDTRQALQDEISSRERQIAEARERYNRMASNSQQAEGAAYLSRWISGQEQFVAGLRMALSLLRVDPVAEPGDTVATDTIALALARVPSDQQ